MLSCGSSLASNPLSVQQLGRFLARDEPIEPVEFRNIGTIDRAIRMQHIDDRQLVALTDLEIEFVVRRRHLQNAGAKFRIDPVIAR